MNKVKLFNYQRYCIQNCTKRINIFYGSVRAGKTWASIYKWIQYCKYGPKRGPLAMIGKTERTLYRNIIEPLQSILGKSIQYNQGKGELYIGKRRIFIFGAHDKRSEEKIRGGTWAGCYGDELTLWPKEVFKMALSRMSIDGAQFFGTTNADSPYHWLKTDYLDRSELDLSQFSFSIDDNVRPYGFLSSEFVENLKKEYFGLWYKRFIQGLWVLAEGVIYDMWDESRHVEDLRNKKFSHYGMALDYGTNNPFTVGLYGWNNPEITVDTKMKEKIYPKVYLISEYYYDSTKSLKQKTDRQYAEALNQWFQSLSIPKNKIEVFYIDPSAASFKAEIRNDWPVKDANNNVLDGIRFCSTLLGQDRFIVNKCCKNTIMEFVSYAWDEKSRDRGEDVPLKKNDHCMDRNRYFLYSHFGPKRKRVGVWSEEK